jgi:DNA mismatch repair protein MLH1
MGQLKLSTPISIKECVLIAIAIEETKGNVPDDLKSAEEIAEV